MALALRHGKQFNGHEIVVERPDGSRVTALAHANPIFDESGQLLGAVNVLVDISDRKRDEEELQRAKKDREAQLADLTRLHGQLHETQQRKDEFLATMAHELRNPLAPIQNAVRILRSHGPLEPTLQWARDVIDRQVRQMARLLDDLLDVSRMTTGKLAVHTAHIELRDVLHAALEVSRPLLKSCGVQFTIKLPAEPVELDGDQTRLAQVVANLLNNAAKHTPRDGHVWLSAERQGSDAVVTVRDSGVGIAATLLPRIFEMFTHLDLSLDRAQGGLGIGLCLSRRLVELHGGTLTAHSDGPGQGSTFVVRLPVMMSQAPPRPSAKTNDLPVPKPDSLRILVVDDNRDTAVSLAMLLRLQGHEVQTAHDGLEAVGAAARFHPEVVLLDIGLPRLNGYEAAQRIRQQPGGNRMVLIATTGWGQETDRRRSQAAGFDHHLVKPVDPAALLQLLAALTPTIQAQR
jgi:signal transduction histidine kinase/CheY-like chemotaxis protein